MKPAELDVETEELLEEAKRIRSIYPAREKERVKTRWHSRGRRFSGQAKFKANGHVSNGVVRMGRVR